jgi:hypothetical protein
MVKFGVAVLKRSPEMTAKEILQLLQQYAHGHLGNDGITKAIEGTYQRAKRKSAEEQARAHYLVSPQVMEMLALVREQYREMAGEGKSPEHIMERRFNHTELMHMRKKRGAPEMQKATFDEYNEMFHRVLYRMEEAERGEDWFALLERERIIKLNIGGRVFHVESQTLLRSGEGGSKYIKEHLFTCAAVLKRVSPSSDKGQHIVHAINHGRYVGESREGLKHYAMVKPGDSGVFFIDRNSEAFPWVLAYFRGHYGNLPYPEMEHDDLLALQAEAEFYQIWKLVDLCKNEAIVRRRRIDEERLMEMKKMHRSKLGALMVDHSSAVSALQAGHKSTMRAVEVKLSAMMEEIAKLRKDNKELGVAKEDAERLLVAARRQACGTVKTESSYAQTIVSAEVLNGNVDQKEQLAALQEMFEIGQGGDEGGNESIGKAVSTKRVGSKMGKKEKRKRRTSTVSITKAVQKISYTQDELRSTINAVLASAVAKQHSGGEMDPKAADLKEACENYMLHIHDMHNAANAQIEALCNSIMAHHTKDPRLHFFGVAMGVLQEQYYSPTFGKVGVALINQLLTKMGGISEGSAKEKEVSTKLDTAAGKLQVPLEMCVQALRDTKDGGTAMLLRFCTTDQMEAAITHLGGNSEVDIDAFIAVVQDK